MTKDNSKPPVPIRQTIGTNVFYSFDHVLDEAFLYNETLVNLSAIIPIFKQELLKSKLKTIFTNSQQQKYLCSSFTACLGRSLRLLNLIWNPQFDIFTNTFVIVQNNDTLPIFVDISRMASDSGKTEKELILSNWKKAHIAYIPLLTNWSIRTYFTGRLNKLSNKILNRGSVIQTLECIFYVDNSLFEKREKI